MNTVKLNTGANIPRVGFGTWQLHSKEAREAVANALQAGYRLIDTARIYRNERGVGKAIAQSEVPRNEIFITTKLWNFNQGYKSAHRAFNASLKRLGMDYVDLYLIHWPVTDKRQDSWRALEEIHQSGRAKAIGVSNYTVRHLRELLASSGVVPVVSQVEFHPFLYKEQIELLEFCKKHNIIVEAYSPLAHGHNLDNPVLTAIAKKYDKSVPQVMLRWAIQHGTVPIPKSTSPERIKQNIEIFDFELMGNEITQINNLSNGLRTCWNPENMA